MYQKSAPETIQSMFASIAPHYDRANSIFSFGLHQNWNRKLIKAVGKVANLLDLCAGTGEIALGFLKKNPESRAILLDFCPQMLAIAENKGKIYRSRFQLLPADAQQIPLSTASIDAISMAYGIRNVENPKRCFEEAFRVLRPGARFCILELTRPKGSLTKMGHQCYTRYVLPLIGKISAKNFEAYRYLASSVENFQAAETMISDLSAVGFKNIETTTFTFGTATLIIARK